ncbi:MAG: 50S ribosomal protein L29 [Candidatus Bathyarchaeota archaeon]
MPFIRLKEIREMPSEKRVDKLIELQGELSRLRAMIKVGGSIENPSRVREIKKAIAKILTVENEEKAEVMVKI